MLLISQSWNNPSPEWLARDLGGDLTEFSFWPMDGPERYQKNRVNMGSQWIWADRPVTYTLNNQGYRAPNWQDCDWTGSVLAQGCSMTFGIGVSDHETWPSVLSQLLGRPVINLGQAGAGIPFLWINSQRLITQGIRPRLVISLWPDYMRGFDVNEQGVSCHPGQWQWGHRKNQDNSEWVRHEPAIKMVRETMIESLNWGRPKIDWTWIRGWRYPQPRWIIDQARDLEHPGPLSHRLLAEKLARVISYQGLL